MLPPILQIGDVLISSDLLTEYFCCDLEKCKGICCVEGDAGAPVTLEEVGCIEEVLDEVWDDLSPSAQRVIDRQGVAYTDEEGDLVTSIVNGKECVFARSLSPNCSSLSPEPSPKGEGSCWLCMLEKVARQKAAAQKPPTSNPSLPPQEGQEGGFIKPISCALYPIREKRFGNGLVGLNYHRWKVCRDAVEKGKALRLPVYQFLKDPLIRRFGEEWYQELCEVANELLPQNS